MSEFYPRPLDPEKNSQRNPILARALGRIGTEMWFRHNDDTGQLDMIVHPGNTQVYLSQIDSFMDAVTVKDPRDNMTFMTFRDELGDDQFLNMVDALQPYAAVIGVPFLPQEIIDTYLNRKMKDLSVSDSFPEEWSNGTEQA